MTYPTGANIDMYDPPMQNYYEQREEQWYDSVLDSADPRVKELMKQDKEFCFRVSQALDTMYPVDQAVKDIMIAYIEHLEEYDGQFDDLRYDWDLM